MADPVAVEKIFKRLKKRRLFPTILRSLHLGGSYRKSSCLSIVNFFLLTLAAREWGSHLVVDVLYYS